MDSPRHATAQVLILTTVALIEENGPQSITIDQVLDTSGVSRGSLYHHFGDFPSLVDHALLAIYKRFTDAAVVEMTAAFEGLNTIEAFRDAIHAVNVINATDEAARNRMIRTWTVAQALVRPTLRDLLSTQQAAYNAALLSIIERGQARDWLREDLDAKSLALLVQASWHGTTLDQLVDDPVDRTEYVQMLDDVMERTMFTDEARAALANDDD